ncbi:MAG: hypothetical protein LiPW16_113 [Microgenomates group bacterium LiPW_16]|nr:MAG: hypothetical protein LiPW16_113 [Microgenomates group bacterium LiPW_16]
MKKETPQLPVSPQEVQIQAPTFLDKLKIHRWKILSGILGVLVFAGAVFGAYKFGQKQVQPVPKPTPTPVAVSTPTPDPTADWKTYINTKYGYSIKHPVSYLLEDFSIGTTHQIGISGVYFKAIIRVRKEEELPYYLDQESSGEIELGGIKAKLYKFLSGYCDMGECTEPFIAVVAYKNSQRYALEFYEAALRKTELDWITHLMLSTFKFLEEKESTGEKVFCKEPRPEVCTMECIQNPPYICGSDGKSYCSTCQACSNSEVEWYVIQDELCKTE